MPTSSEPTPPALPVDRCRVVCALLLCLGLCLLPGLVQAEESRPGEPTHTEDTAWQVSVTPNYSSGDYGAGSKTTIWYAPLSLQRLFKDGDITLVVPYVSVTGDCSVTLLSGVPNRTNHQCGSPTPERGRRKRDPATPDPIVTNSGLGDVVLRGRYYLMDGKEWMPTIAVTGRLKIPTADADKGLGTGEPDEGLGIELTKTMGAKWVSFADAGYTFIGKPAGVDLRNQWYYDVGIGYYVTKDFLISGYYEYYRSLLAGYQAPQDFLFAANYTLSGGWSLNGSTQIGLSDGAPAYAFSVGIAYGF